MNGVWIYDGRTRQEKEEDQKQEKQEKQEKDKQEKQAEAEGVRERKGTKARLQGLVRRSSRGKFVSQLSGLWSVKLIPRWCELAPD